MARAHFEVLQTALTMMEKLYGFSVTIMTIMLRTTDLNIRKHSLTSLASGYSACREGWTVTEP